ncbi:MAG: hypothetical protein EXX96DRAFT_616990 [Benjaminiella poitrasii]|nr:MAG: hypothetical protein EXX96DRAFT_616990 [Benjaminiella poitrasii]
MNYAKGKIAEKLHVPQIVETVRVQGSAQLVSYSKRIPYLNQTLPSHPMTDRKRTKLLKKIRRLSQWLDNAVPYSPIPLGIDSILGFVPLIGGPLSSLLALYQVYLSTTFGIPIWLFMQMIMNIAIDLIFSVIPLLGGFLHMFYKANTYNYEALQDYVNTPEYLERAQLRERNATSNKPSPGEVTWAQLGMDIKNMVPFTTKKTSNKKPE